MSGKYDDILSLPHPEPSRHPRMSLGDRAAQFSPFAALTGYDAVIREAGRLTGSPVELQEDARALLDQKQQLILELGDAAPDVSVTYFLPDSRKDGGAYVTKQGRLKLADPHRRTLLFTDGTSIPLDTVIDLESPVFDRLPIAGDLISEG